MVSLINNDSIASSGVFLNRYLEQVLPKVYEKHYRELKFGNGTLLPASPTLQAGAESVIELVQEYVGEVGEAIGGQVDDINLADVGMAESSYPVVVKAIGTRYSIRELQAAAKGNLDLKGKKEMAARKALEESINTLAACGDTKKGVYGLLNEQNITVNSSISDDLYDAAFDADDLINFFSTQVADIISDTALTEAVNTILVTPKLHERMTMLRVGDSDTTVRKFILKNSPWITDIQPIVELQSSFLEANGVHTAGTNKDSILIYKRDPETVERLFEPIQMLPPQLRGMNYITVWFYASTGAIAHYPKAVVRLDHAKSA